MTTDSIIDSLMCWDLGSIMKHLVCSGACGLVWSLLRGFDRARDETSAPHLQVESVQLQWAVTGRYEKSSKEQARAAKEEKVKMLSHEAQSVSVFHMQPLSLQPVQEIPLLTEIKNNCVEQLVRPLRVRHGPRLHHGWHVSIHTTFILIKTFTQTQAEQCSALAALGQKLNTEQPLLLLFCIDLFLSAAFLVQESEDHWWCKDLFSLWLTCFRQNVKVLLFVDCVWRTKAQEEVVKTTFKQRWIWMNGTGHRLWCSGCNSIQKLTMQMHVVSTQM